MKNEFRELFFLEKYEEALVLAKEQLQTDTENSDLWYTLFLAENKNYIDFDFSSGGKDEMMFNKAIELANRRQKNEYIAEYNVYKGLNGYPFFKKILRYAQMGKSERLFELLENYNDNQIIELELDDDFFSDLDYCVGNYSTASIIDCCLIACNFLYLKTNDERYNDILNELTSDCEKSKGCLNPYKVCQNLDSLNKKLTILFNNYNSNSELDQIDKLLFKIQVLISDGEFEDAQDVIDDVLVLDDKNAKALYYLAMATLMVHNDDELVSKVKNFDSNNHLKKAYSYATGSFKEHLEALKVNASNITKYNKAKKIMNKDPLEALLIFKEISDYEDTADLINECQQKIYDNAIKEANLGNYSIAIKELEDIKEFKDTANLINEYNVILIKKNKKDKKESAKYQKKQAKIQKKSEKKTRTRKTKRVRNKINLGFSKSGFFIIAGCIVSIIQVCVGLFSDPTFIYNPPMFMSLILPISFVLGTLLAPSGDDLNYNIKILMVATVFLVLSTTPIEFLDVVRIITLAIGMIVPTVIVTIKESRFSGTLFFGFLFSLLMFLGIPLWVLLIIVAIISLIFGIKVDDDEYTSQLTKLYAAIMIILAAKAFIFGTEIRLMSTFNFNIHLCIDLLGLSMILVNVHTFSDDGFHPFAKVVYLAISAITLLLVAITSSKVAFGNYENILNLEYVNLYGMYFYALIPAILITIIAYLDLENYDSKFPRIAGIILGLIMLFIAFTFLYKFSGQVFGCSAIEGCGDEVILDTSCNCTNGTGFVAWICQFILLILYAGGSTVMFGAVADA